MRASVDWSYELLPEPERALLRRLSVFAGGLTLDAAERVGATGEVGRYEVLGLLSALVDKSLVQVNDKGDRYRLLETIRAYAAEELAASGEEAAARDRHLAFFAELGERAEKGIWTSATPSWLGVLDAEHDNLRAALDWSLASGQLDAGARLVYAIGQFLYYAAYLSRGPAAGARSSSPTTSPRPGGPSCTGGRPLSPGGPTPRPGAATARPWSASAGSWETTRAVARGLARVGRVATTSPTPWAALGDTRGGARHGPGRRRRHHRRGLPGCISDANMRPRPLPRGSPLGRGGTGDGRAHRVRLGYRLGHCARGSRRARTGRARPRRRCRGRLDGAGTRTWTTSTSRRCAHWVRGIVGMYRSEPSAAQDLVAARQLAERTHNNLGLGGHLLRPGPPGPGSRPGRSRACRVLEEAVPLADAFQSIYSARTRCLLAEAAVRRG